VPLPPFSRNAPKAPVLREPSSTAIADRRADPGEE